MIRFQKRQRVLRRHLRKNAIRAAVGIEFAFVAPVFFLLLLGIIETGIMFYAQNTLTYAVETTGRMIRTGTAQGTTAASAAQCSGSAYAAGTTYSTSQQWFKDQICCGISGLLTNCGSTATTGALHVNVQNYTSGFTSFSSTADSNGYQQAVTDTYSPGNPCDVVLVRATYNWTVITPLLTTFLVNMADGQSHLLVATTAFRNEPYTAGSQC